MPSSYVVGEHFEAFIQVQLQNGRYTSASEVICEGLRVLENRERFRAMQREALRAEILKGINSGPGAPLEEVARELTTRYRQWAKEGPPADAL